MNDEVGGITGGLYQLFEAVGLVFFTVLIGAKRARRDRLQSHRVVVGGGTAGGLIGSILAAVGATAGSITAPGTVGLGASGFLLGAVLGFLVGLVLLGYVSAVDRDIQREDAERKKKHKYEEVKRRRLDELLQAGLNQADAETKAEQEAHRLAYGSCFVATVCYGHEAEQIQILRRWRDARLMGSWHGRLVVRAYERVGPIAARLLVGRPRTRATCRRLLDLWCSRLRKQELAILQRQPNTRMHPTAQNRQRRG